MAEASLNRPDLLPPGSPGYLAWRAQFERERAAQARQRQEDAIREWATFVEKKKQQGGYGGV